MVNMHYPFLKVSLHRPDSVNAVARGRARAGDIAGAQTVCCGESLIHTISREHKGGISSMSLLEIGMLL